MFELSYWFKLCMVIPVPFKVQIRFYNQLVNDYHQTSIPTKKNSFLEIFFFIIFLFRWFLQHWVPRRFQRARIKTHQSWKHRLSQVLLPASCTSLQSYCSLQVSWRQSPEQPKQHRMSQVWLLASCTSVQSYCSLQVSWRQSPEQPKQSRWS